MIDFRMPSLGADMEEGTLVEWLVAPPETPPVVLPAMTPATPVAPVPSSRDGVPPPFSPAARALAAEAGIDLAGIAGSRPGGAILRADVEARLAAAPAADRPSAKPGLDPAAMWRAIGAAMSRAKRGIPHYYLAQTVGLQPAADWLTALFSNNNLGRHRQPSWPAAQLRDDSGHDHRLQHGRGRVGCAGSGDLPAVGRDPRVRRTGPPPLDRGRDRCSPDHRYRDAVRRPPGLRRPPRRPPADSDRPLAEGVRTPKTPAELRHAYLQEVANVAPDIGPATVGDDDHLQDDLDSMDVLNLVAALHQRFGASIPEPDYPQIATPALAVAYLAAHMA